MLFKVLMWAWIPLGLIGLLTNRWITLRVERLLGLESEFLNWKFFKDHSFKIFYGPIYLLSIVWNFVLNFNVFDKARKLKKEKDKQEESISEFITIMQDLSKNMAKIYNDLSVQTTKEDKLCKVEAEEEIEDHIDVLKDIDNIFKDLNEDE